MLQFQPPQRSQTSRLAAIFVFVACGAAMASVSSDTDFTPFVLQLVSWTKGTLGSVLKLSSLLIGIALAVKTQRLPIPVSLTFLTIAGPDAIEAVFGALI